MGRPYGWRPPRDAHALGARVMTEEWWADDPDYHEFLDEMERQDNDRQ